jgi:hypothetical protein
MRRIGIFILFLIAFSHAQKAPDSISIATLDSLATSLVPGRIITFDTLTGPLCDTIKVPKNTYLVIGDIEVPINKTVVINPGVIFLFKNFTGLHVLGKLIAQGTKDHPIIFTSENDRSCNKFTTLYPNPFDWNGVYIHPDGVETTLSFCKVLYSVYGIISETKFIRLDQITLKLNGKSNLKILGKEIEVTDKPYSQLIPVKEVAAITIPVKIPKNPLIAKREILRFSSITFALATTAAAAYFETRNKPKAYTASAGLLALAGYAGFVWSFYF